MRALHLSGRPAAWLAVGLLFLLSVSLCAGGCGPSEEDCALACAKPFRMVEEMASQRGEAWQRLPTPYAEPAAAVYSAWVEHADEVREAYLRSCVPECRKSGDSAGVTCRSEARTLMEWKRCGSRN